MICLGKRPEESFALLVLNILTANVVIFFEKNVFLWE